MQPDGEALPKVTEKRSESATRYFERLPSYVVSFALKETYDDLVTAQQMICNKRSPQESTNSITPTNSIKMLESDHTVKLDQILDVHESKSKEVNESVQKTCLTVSEFDSPNQQIQNTIVKNVKSVNDETKASTHSITNVPSENNEKADQPEVIFNAINYSHRIKHNKFLKRKSKAFKSVKTKCNKFKCKAPKNSICNRLEKYYEKTKSNSVKCDIIQQGFSNISTVVSRTGVLKKVLAKENLLEETELISVISNDSNLCENFDESQSSHASTVKNESFISDSSGNTLTRKSSSISSKIQDTYSLENIESVIRMPFNTEVINGNVTVAYNKTKVVTTDEMFTKTEELIYLENLTSAETLIVDVSNLTSKVPSDFVKTMSSEKIKSNKNSDFTLEMKSSFDVSSDDDTYDMARTSSDFNESNNSTLTLKNNLEKIIDTEKNILEDIEKPNAEEYTLLQTVINLGYYPEVTPSTSSAGVLDIDQNNFIVTENSKQKYKADIKNMGDNGNKNEINTNLLKKIFNEQSISPDVKNVNLPKQAQINAMLTENNVQQKNCTEESRFYPSNLPEMCDRLILVIDVAFKRLEKSLTEKIIREMKNTIATLELKPIPEHDVDLEKGDSVEPPSSNKLMPAQELNRQTNECLQCELIQNGVIDQIMFKLSEAGPKILEPETSVSALHKLKAKTFRDYLKVLTSPILAEPDVLVDKGDTVTISTVTEELDRFHHLKLLFFGPLNFIRENVFVIASVPAFFIVLLFVYVLLMVAIKPW